MAPISLYFYFFSSVTTTLSTKVVTPICNDSARSAALCELVVRLVNDSLTEYSYAAYVAELQYGLKATDAGFQVGFLVVLYLFVSWSRLEVQKLCCCSPWGCNSFEGSSLRTSISSCSSVIGATSLYIFLRCCRVRSCLPAQIHVYGFNHKAPLMLREVLKRLLDLGPHLKEGEPAQLNVAMVVHPSRNACVWL